MTKTLRAIFLKTLLLAFLCVPIFSYAAEHIAIKHDTKNKVDKRGFVNPWALQRALNKLASLPKGDADCSSQRDETSENLSPVQLKKLEQVEIKAEKVCEKKIIAEQKKYQSAHLALNKTWLPILDTAMKQGDPVAEVILRMCETTDLLDRQNIASDCAANKEQQDFAKSRLLAIDFKPAHYHYMMTNAKHNDREIGSACGERNTLKGNICWNQYDSARYDEKLALIKLGMLGVGVDYGYCENSRGGEAADLAMTQCITKGDLMIEAVQAANQFYTLAANDTEYINLSLMRTDSTGVFQPSARRDGSYKTLAIIRPMLSSMQESKVLDESYAEKLYAETYLTLQAIKQNIQADLAKEPRWAVFLLTQATPAPPLSKNPLTKFIGNYQGGLISTGTSSVITKLYADNMGQLVGRYMMISGEDKFELGSLSPCITRDEQNLLCRWKDKYGDGFVNMYFDKKYASFQGEWMPNLDDAEHPQVQLPMPKVGPYSKGDMTSWNGTRQ